MFKTIIDCSKPFGHPEREITVEITGDELAAMLASSAEAEAAALEPKQKTAEERIAELEEKLAEILEEK